MHLLSRFIFISVGIAIFVSGLWLWKHREQGKRVELDLSASAEQKEIVARLSLPASGETAQSGVEDIDRSNEKQCVIGGCSGQSCVEFGASSSASNCEYKEKYACYKTAQCAVQSDGRCGWTQTPELFRCLESKKEPVVLKPGTVTEKGVQKPAGEKDVSKEDNQNTTTSPPTNIPQSKSSLVSWGFESAEDRKIYAVILHSSYNPLGGDEYDVDKIVAIYKQYGVAAHYIIGRDGVVRQLVAEKNIAYHAGASILPNGEKDVNRVSIGIEIVGNESSGFTDKQYASINDLIGRLRKKHSLKYVLGHDEIAPGRKTDPWKIDWDKIKK